MRYFMIAAVAAVISLTVTPIVCAQDAPDVPGIWQGTLNVSGIKLRVVFKIERTEDGSLTATMDSPDQGASDIPVDTVTFADGHLHISMPDIMMSLDGEMSEDGDTITCDFLQRGMTLPLTLARTEQGIELLRPQEPELPYPYDTVAVTFENKKDNVTLAGTLTLPRAESPFPAALLITGSGAQNRNEMVFGHRPFLVLADYLTRQGIAVLRFDDRGVGKSTGDFASATSEDFAADVLAGVEFLKNRDEIDSDQIGLIGHSEGGIIAPMVAAQSDDVAFIVLMAGTGVPGDEVLYEQSVLVAKAEGADESLVEENRQMQKALFWVLKTEPDSATAAERVRQILSDALSQLSDEDAATLGVSKTMVDAQVEQLMSPWFRYFLTYDPAPVLAKVKCPVLAINGEHDLQVPPNQNLPAIEAALKAGGNQDYTVQELAGLNHLFQTSQTGAVSAYGEIEETLAPVALETISGWILERVK